MIRRLPVLTCLLALLVPTPADAQARLTLADALARARAVNVDARAAEAAEREAVERVTQARAGYFPRVDLTEAWQRGNQPVFVFSSLLAQREFTAANFAIDALNHPDPVNNFRVSIMAEQAIYSPSMGASLRAAELGRSVATAGRGMVDQDLGVAVANAYGQVLVAMASKEAAAAAIAAASADRERAGHRRDAGMATDADVLQVDVHLARMRELQIRADADERIARARLNQVMGEPLDAVFVLEQAADPGAAATTDVAALEAEALMNRPEIRVSQLQLELAGAAHDAARATFLPQVSALGGWEANGGQWNSRASSWAVGVAARIPLFQGLADRARLAEARAQTERRAAEREKAETSARLDVRVAAARLDASRAAEAVGRAASAQARESHRILRNRYDAGLADITSLLRAAETVAQADARQVAARVEVLLAQAALDRAVGRR
jgi:outer membrane protein TolC